MTSPGNKILVFSQICVKSNTFAQASHDRWMAMRLRTGEDADAALATNFACCETPAIARDTSATGYIGGSLSWRSATSVIVGRFVITSTNQYGTFQLWCPDRGCTSSDWAKYDGTNYLFTSVSGKCSTHARVVYIESKNKISKHIKNIRSTVFVKKQKKVYLAK